MLWPYTGSHLKKPILMNHRLFIRAALLLMLATAPVIAQAAREATVTQASSIAIGTQKIPLPVGATVKILSENNGKATIDFVGPDGSPVIAQVDLALLKENATTPTSKGTAAAVPPQAGAPALAAPTGASLLPDKLKCEYRVDPIGIDVPTPRLGWILTSANPAARGLTQTAYQILVATSPSVLAQDQGDLWDSGKVATDQMNQLSYGGKELVSSQPCWWKVRVWDQTGNVSAWSAPAKWTMGVLTDADWQSAKWLAAPDANEPNDHKGPKAKYETVLLRREFTVKPGLTRAIVHVCGLGQYEMTLNGAKVGTAVMAPGWTLYNKTCLYDSYDITSALVAGPNAVGLFLGNGFYNIHGQRYTKIQDSFGPLQAIALIELDYGSGQTEYVVTDDQWKTSSGPITFSSIYGGEDFDARLVQDGWDKPGFDQSSWEQPTVTKGPGGALKGLSCSGPPIRVFDVLTPVGTKDLGSNVKVYDLGQNAALLLNLKVKGAAGSTVKVIPSELVGGDGNINDTMCNGDSYWTYTLSGKGDESYSSKFYYRGGRYLRVEVKGPPGNDSELPEIESIEGDTIHADAASAGQFSCSNDMLNKVYSITRWAQMNNMMSTMTDCPTREKLGWLEEDHLNGPALRYNFDLATLLSKMVHDMADSQRSDGLVPSTCPDFPNWGEGSYTNPPEWGSACIVVPWQQYQFEGDLTLLREDYNVMKGYVKYLSDRANDNIVNFGLGDWYDNGSFGAATLTPVSLTATAFYYYDTKTLGQIATLLGNTDDATHYQDQAARILASFNKKFFNSDTNNYATGSQASNAVPLALDMVDPAVRPAVLDNLVKDFSVPHKTQSSLEDHTTVGEVCEEFLLRALADGGRSDLLYSVYSSDKAGYGLQVKQGKTTLAEGWNGGATLGSPNSYVSSQDHFMFGEINEWFHRSLAGIQNDPAGSGFKQIIIKPSVVGDLTEVKASYDSISGTIVSEWQYDGQTVKLHVTIPPNTTATIYVPANDAASVQESGRPAANSDGIKAQGMDSASKAAIFAVASGDYTFSSVFQPETH
jgi:alpha-L-rhamnosidase